MMKPHRVALLRVLFERYGRVSTRLFALTDHQVGEPGDLQRLGNVSTRSTECQVTSLLAAGVGGAEQYVDG